MRPYNADCQDINSPSNIPSGLDCQRLSFFVPSSKHFAFLSICSVWRTTDPQTPSPLEAGGYAYWAPCERGL